MALRVTRALKPAVCPSHCHDELPTLHPPRNEKVDNTVRQCQPKRGNQSRAMQTRTNVYSPIYLVYSAGTQHDCARIELSNHEQRWHGYGHDRLPAQQIWW